MDPMIKSHRIAYHQYPFRHFLRSLHNVETRSPSAMGHGKQIGLDKAHALDAQQIARFERQRVISSS